MDILLSRKLIALWYRDSKKYLHRSGYPYRHIAQRQYELSHCPHGEIDNTVAKTAINSRRFWRLYNVNYTFCRCFGDYYSRQCG